jgi:predicted DNA-binding antitoxin AbrB/MazE fold protein
MVVSVRAVYKEGQLQLLEPVDLVEGQIVDVTIQSEPQQAGLTIQTPILNNRGAVVIRVRTAARCDTVPAPHR